MREIREYCIKLYMLNDDEWGGSCQSVGGSIITDNFYTPENCASFLIKRSIALYNEETK